MNPKCIFPNCKAKDSTPRCRGLCNSHYQYAYRLVREHLTTWNKLEENGKVLPRQKYNKASAAKRWFLE